MGTELGFQPFVQLFWQCSPSFPQFLPKILEYNIQRGHEAYVYVFMRTELDFSLKSR